MGKYSRGFTIVELLVAIAIIGILVSIVLVSYDRAAGGDSDVQQSRY